MRIYCSAYLAYGIQIPDTDGDTLEAALKELANGVSYLHAGRFNEQRTYLTAECHGVEAGGYLVTVSTTVTDRPEHAAWDTRLKAAAEALGHTDTAAPAWLMIPDLDN